MKFQNGGNSYTLFFVFVGEPAKDRPNNPHPTMSPSAR